MATANDYDIVYSVSDQYRGAKRLKVQSGKTAYLERSLMVAKPRLDETSIDRTRGL